MAVNSTAIWRVRPSGSNTNGGGYDSGIASAGTDFSQQNAAHLSQSSTANTSTSTTTLTDTGASFTSALIGNGIWVSGTGITTSFTFITAVPSGTTLTLQTSPGTTGTSVSYNIGGGWADPWTNGASTGPVVPGNIVYVLGSGTPSPASYTFDYSYSSASTVTLAVGSVTAGYITWANDPATPGYLAPPNTTGGMPCIKISYSGAAAGIFVGGYQVYSGLWIVAGGTIAANSNLLNGSSGTATAFGCVCDQNTNDIIPFYRCNIIGCEIFTSVAPGSAGSNYAVLFDSLNTFFIDGCNIHDCVGGGVKATGTAGGVVVNCIIAKNRIDGFNAGANGQSVVAGNTIDGNLGNGITLGADVSFVVMNNIISNHTQAGKFGISGIAKPYAFIDYNTYYNNTSNYSNVPAGPHDTALGTNPYVGQSTENYTLA